MSEEKVYKFDNRSRNRKAIKCSHENERGMTLISSPKPGSNDHICTMCGEVFNMQPIESKDLGEAINIIQTAMDQLKTQFDSEEDQIMIERLGVDHYNLSQVGEMYNKMNDLFVDDLDDKAIVSRDKKIRFVKRR